MLQKVHVGDQTKRLQSVWMSHDIPKGQGEQPEVVVHIGTNYIIRKEVMWSEYRELGKG